MKTIFLTFIIFFISSFTFSSLGQGGQYNIKEALSSVSDLSESSLQLFWGDQKYPDNSKEIKRIKTSGRVSAINKSDKEACFDSFASSVRSLKKKAKAIGANAIVNIKSSYKTKTLNSSKLFICNARGIIATITLSGIAIKTK